MRFSANFHGRLYHVVTTNTCFASNFGIYNDSRGLNVSWARNRVSDARFPCVCIGVACPVVGT